jgi:hypothetical protein
MQVLHQRARLDFIDLNSAPEYHSAETGVSTPWGCCVAKKELLAPHTAFTWNAFVPLRTDRLTTFNAIYLLLVQLAVVSVAADEPLFS